MKKLLFIIFFFIFSSLLFPIRTYAEEVELFNDPNFSNGVAVGYGNTYPDSADQACINRWKSILPSYSNIKWMFTEISERFYFCDNTNNNPSVGTNSIRYISPNYGMKKFTSDRNGTVRMEHDTSWEWRGGCNLSLPWIGVDPNPPKYGDSYTNWPHFLVSQILSPSYTPSQYDTSNPNVIPLTERVNLTKYNKIQFTGQFRLNNIEKIGNSQCPVTDWNTPNTPNHAIFYVAFILWRNIWNNPRIADVPNVIYQLLPIVYSNDGVANIGGLTSYIMGDQFGDRTYFAKLGDGVTANVPKLTKGSPTFETLNIDVAAFSSQVLNEINPNLNPSDYFVSAFLAGWEIWGGYKTDIELQSLSLKGITSSTPTPIPPTATPIPPTETPIPPSPTPILIPGDINHDGVVNIYDYNLLITDFGKSNSSADIDGNGKVDIYDYNILITNFGRHN